MNNRKLAAAFRIVNGQKMIVQPEPEEIETPPIDLWMFWIERWTSQPRTMGLFMGPMFMQREPVAETWHETPELARWMREACAA